MDAATLALVIAIVGNAVSIVLVILSNTSASRREERRLDREDRRLEVQRTDGVVHNVREVQRDYYLDFYLQLRAASLRVHNAGYKIEPPLAFAWQLPAYEALLRLRVFASDFAYAVANEAYDTLWRWGELGGVNYHSKEEIEFDTALDAYLSAMQHDLGFGSAGRSGGPGH